MSACFYFNEVIIKNINAVSYLHLMHTDILPLYLIFAVTSKIYETSIKQCFFYWLFVVDQEYSLSLSIMIHTINRHQLHLFSFQVHHTFATAGSDGAFNFWDKDSKQRLKVCCLVYNSFSWFIWDASNGN